MKIDNNYTNYEVDSLPHRTANVPGEKTGQTENARSLEMEKASPDTVVNLSRKSKEAQLIKETIEKTQDVRQEKVDQLKKRDFKQYLSNQSQSHCRQDDLLFYQ